MQRTSTDNKKYIIEKTIKENANISLSKYQENHQLALNNPDQFWQESAKNITWHKFPSKIKNVTWSKNHVDIKWYEDGKLNLCENCLDRHLPHHADKTAIIWESDDGKEHENISYAQLHAKTCQFSNLLGNYGIAKGDRVIIYMPMIPQAAIAMLACLRIGAIHSVVFGGFSPQALAQRIKDCQANTIITASHGLRGGKYIPLKENVNQAIRILANDHLTNAQQVKNIFVANYDNFPIKFKAKTELARHVTDINLDKELVQQSKTHQAVSMNAEDPSFILYTSGSTGKPKGILHTTGGYGVYVNYTFKTIFDYKENEIFWCTADVGWITGHSYVVYGPLSNGATTLMFEGIPTYPQSDRFWQICDKHKVNIFYTAPTAIRALMCEDESLIEKNDLSSLRILGSVGEPINPEAWKWFYEKIGHNKCPIIDTWWQTETGGILIAPLVGVDNLLPSSAGKPFFGITADIIDNEGNILHGQAEGNLVISTPWPGQARSIYNDHKRFISTYFQSFPNYYFTGDGAKRDKDGNFWITGRVDDVLNISGHRLGTAEIESALNSHQLIAETAVVGCPHDIKGQAIYCFVTAKQEIANETLLSKELEAIVKQEIGAIARPDFIHFTPSLPKTRSGKIMRRILRKIAEGEFDKLGDISTLADPSIVADLIKDKKN